MSVPLTQALGHKSMSAEIARFVESERGRFSDYDNNIFAMALGNVSRYYHFLELIVARYEVASANMRGTFQATMTLTEHSHPTYVAARFEEQSQASMLVQIEIESFYIFSKIVLDKLAQFIDRFFGQIRGVRLLSHAKLAKSIGNFTIQKELVISQEHLGQIASLESAICHYRDKQISHNYNLRIAHGTSWSSDGGVKINSTSLYPKEHDADANSDDIVLLLHDIDCYISSTLAFISSNLDRTILSAAGTDGQRP